MLDVYLIRHAQSLANVGVCIGGRMPEMPLTALGESQAVSLGEHFASAGVVFDRVYSSPARRALHTARLSGQIDPILDDRLVEIDRGRWAGKPYVGRYTQQLRDRFKADAHFSWTFAAPGGESCRQCCERVMPFVHELERLEGHIGIYSHRVTIGTIIRQLLDDDPREIFRYHIPNTGITRLSFDDAWRVVSIGETPHLRDVKIPVSPRTGDVE